MKAMMNQQIELLEDGNIRNYFLKLSDKSRPCPLSDRTNEILNYMRLSGYKLKEPSDKAKHKELVMAYSKDRQLRYFTAFAFDQFEYVEKILKDNKYVSFNQSMIETYKDEFVAIYQSEFESGIAMNYADDWYRSFPGGGFFNPIRYKNIYDDERNSVYRISVYMLCNESHPTISKLMRDISFNDCVLVNDAGSIEITYSEKSMIPEILQANLKQMDNNIRKILGEAEATLESEQRLFLSEPYVYSNGVITRILLYNGFANGDAVSFGDHVRDTILDIIPPDEFRDQWVSISCKAYRVTKGEVDAAMKCWKDKDYHRVK